MFHYNKKLSAISNTLFWLFITSTLILSPVYAQKITIGGTGNSLGTMQLIANAYHHKNPHISITILPSIGSSGAIKAVPSGAIDVGLSARKLKAKEKNNNISAVEYARTPTVIAVSNTINVKQTSIQELINMYSGKKLNWQDGTRIRPIVRQADDDNTVQLKSLSPLLKKAIEIAEKRPGILFASTDQETVDKIQRTPGSFGVTSLALIMSEKRPLRALILNGIKPTPEGISTGQYPIVKHFYLILPNVIPQHVKDFISYIKSAEGTEILVKNGNLAVQW